MSYVLFFVLHFPGSRILSSRLSMRLQQSDTLYTSAADMYGLGMLTAELLLGQDIFSEIKQSTSINYFMELKSPAGEIREIVQKAAKSDSIIESKIKLCLDCLHSKRIERKKISEWNDTWRAIHHR